MSRERNSLISAACTTFVVGLAALPLTAPAAVSARSELYSVGATDRFCSRAQQIISSINFDSNNVVHTDFTAFANSSSAPYEGPNLGSYNGTLALYPNGDDMPVTTQQYVSQRELGTTGWEYPIVISCKMKTAEAINFHYGEGTAGVQKTCKEVNQQIVSEVYSSLTSIEQRTLRWPQSDIVYTNDVFAPAGPSWLYPLPYLPRVAFLGVDGKLRFRGLAITVARTDPSTAAGPDKKGSYYCHLPSPEYVRALVTGQTNPIIEIPPE
jgi:hypothetical protein